MKEINKLKIWDKKLPESYISRYKVACKKLNSLPFVSIPRCIGNFNDTYQLVSFCDASRKLIGAVIYVKNVTTGCVQLLWAKNKMVTENLDRKSTPILEALALEMAADMSIDIYKVLTQSVCRVNIQDIFIFVDSMISFHWVGLYFNKPEKIKKFGPLLRNRFAHIKELSKIHSLQVAHIKGKSNISDICTRNFSIKAINKSEYFTGPEFLLDNEFFKEFDFITVPELENMNNICLNIKIDSTEPLITLDRFSSFRKSVHVIKNVLSFIKKVKVKIGKEVKSNNLYSQACTYLIKRSQLKYFQGIFEYLAGNKFTKKSTPYLHNKLNLHISPEGILRVKAKMTNAQCNYEQKFPILLHDKCSLTKSIIWDYHVGLGHVGLGTLITHLRKRFWIIKYVTAIKKLLESVLFARK